MAAPSGLIVAWPSTAASIPSGWSRVTGLDSKFPKGSSTAASTGGADTHTHPDSAHTHTDAHTHAAITSGARSGGVNAQYAGTGSTISNAAHTHPVNFNAGTTASGTSTAGTSSSGGNLPAYFTVIWIKSDGTTNIPSGAVAFWGQATTLIPANWAYADGSGVTTDLRTKFLRGAAAAGDGGSNVAASAHTHTVAHTHPAAAHTHITTLGAPATIIAGAAAGAREAPLGSHHTVVPTYSNTSSDLASDGSASSSQTPDPAYTKLHHIWATASISTFAAGLICAWDGALGSIPGGWLACDGTSSTPNINGGSNHFVKGTSANGEEATTGGAATHTHSISHSHTSNAHTHANSAGASGSATSAIFNVTVSNNVLQGHTHTAGTSGAVTGGSSTDADSLTANTSNDPAFYSVIWIQKSSSTTFNQSVNVTSTTTATMVRQARKIAAVTSSLTASMLRSIGITKSATSTNTAAMIRSVGKLSSVTSSLTPSITTIRQRPQALSATSTTTAAMVRSVLKIVALNVTTTSTLARVMAKTFSLTSTTTATLTKSALKPLSASVTGTMSMVRQLGKVLSVTSATTATVTRRITKPLAVTSTLTTSMLRSAVRTLSASIATTATTVRSVPKPLAASVAVLATLSMTRSVGQILSVTASVAATLVRRVAHALSADVALTPTLAAIRAFLVTLSASVAASPTINRALTKPLAVTLGSSVTMTRQIGKILGLNVTASPTLNKTNFVRLSTTATVIVSLAAGRLYTRTLNVSVGMLARLRRLFVANTQFIPGMGWPRVHKTTLWHIEEDNLADRSDTQ